MTPERIAEIRDLYGKELDEGWELWIDRLQKYSRELLAEVERLRKMVVAAEVLSERFSLTDLKRIASCSQRDFRALQEALKGEGDGP